MNKNLNFSKEKIERLEAIRLESKELWSKLHGLEVEAYGITNEKEENGYTTDLIYQSDMTVEKLLEKLQEDKNE